MRKVVWTKNSFAAGEVSPNIHQSRADLSATIEGLAKCHNLIPLKGGAVIGRPVNTEYEKVSMVRGATRIIPFPKINGVYVLFIFGDKKLDVVSLGGYGGSTNWVPRSLGEPQTTVYNAREASELDYAIYGSLTVLTHKNHPPYQLLFTGESFELSRMEFTSLPWLEDGARGGGRGVNSIEKVELRTKEGEEGKLSITWSRKFDDTYVGRSICLGCLPAERTPSTKYLKNSYIHAKGTVYKSLKSGTSGSDNPFEGTVAGSVINDNGVIWKAVSAQGGIKDYKVVSPYYVWGTIDGVSTTDDKSIGVTLDADRPFTKDSCVVEWYLSVWGEYDEAMGFANYPSYVTFYQNRLVFAGCRESGLSVYLSGYNDFHSFSPYGGYETLEPTRGLSVSVTDTNVSAIKWLTPFGEGILVGCDTSIWMFTIRVSASFSIDFRRISGSGVYSCPPVSAGDSIVYVCGAGRRIKAISGSFETGFALSELTQLADHLFKYQIKQLVYQEEPHSIIWVLLSSINTENYHMYGCCFSSVEKSGYAWHTHSIGDVAIVKSVATLPLADNSETTLWAILDKGIKGLVLSKMDDMAISGGF